MTPFCFDCGRKFACPLLRDSISGEGVCEECVSERHNALLQAVPEVLFLSADRVLKLLPTVPGNPLAYA